MTKLFVEQITVIDFSYFDDQRGIVGESWIMDVELSGELDDQGMVFDFAHVKKQIKQHVDQLVDHKLVFPQQLRGCDVVQQGERLIIEYATPLGKYRHESPLQAVALIPAEHIEINHMASFIADSIQSVLPDNVTGVKVTLRNEIIEGAFYQYSHGLKKHFGDCQRIAHGHRSRIKILYDGQRDETAEHWLADQWRDIYLVTEEDIESVNSVEGIEYLTVRYQANQGEFKLTLPKVVCHVMPTDTTVELIATHLAEWLQRDFRQAPITVYAYEGVQKGAIASLS